VGERMENVCGYFILTSADIFYENTSLDILVFCVRQKYNRDRLRDVEFVGSGSMARKRGDHAKSRSENISVDILFFSLKLSLSLSPFCPSIKTTYFWFF
jgi:hypothetical protein